MLRTSGLTVALVAVTAILSVGSQALAQGDGRGSRGSGWSHLNSSSSDFPWNYPGYRGYNEPPSTMVTTGPASQPQKYQLYATTLPEQFKADPNVATIVAHVPENAAIWIQDELTSAKGSLREFVSPALEPNKLYVYSVRVGWIENGKVVSQSNKVSVKPGAIHCVYLMEAKASLGTEASVTANLAKLSQDDRALAEKQGFCAVQEGIKLGAMGTPVKIFLNGQTVFLCCDSCIARAKADPERTIANANKKKAVAASK